MDDYCDDSIISAVDDYVDDEMMRNENDELMMNDDY
jgi:hypothetical protein